MNTPLSLVTEQEMKAIECHINNYAEESCGVPIPYLLREWNAQKTPIFNQVFNGKSLIMSKYVSVTKSSFQIAEEMSRIWDESLSREARELYHRFSHFCSEKRREIHFDARGDWRYDITDTEQELELEWYRCENMLCNEYLAANRIDEEFTIPLPKPDGTTRKYHVQKGSRPMRVLSQIMKAYNRDFEGCEEGFKDFSVWQSRMLNDKKLEGELCLSIHPLDYITMSENTYGWTSCMNWPENGCYRSGTVEMMNSPMVIVAYLKSKDPLTIDTGWTYDHDGGRRTEIEWSSKKWRTLIIVHNTGIYSVKAYPYQHDKLTTFAMEWIASCIKDRSFNDPVEFEPYRSFTLEGMRVHTISPRTHRMYNDFGSTKHFAMFDVPALKKINEEEEMLSIRIDYSGASECMSCGELLKHDYDNNISFESEGQLCCDKCDPNSSYNEAYCDCCGDYFDGSDGIWVQDSFVCPYCFENECFEDSWTYDYHFNDDRIDLYVTDENKIHHVGFVSIYNLKKWYKDPEDKKFLKNLNNKKIYISANDLVDMGKHYYERMLAREKVTIKLYNSLGETVSFGEAVSLVEF